MRIQNNDEQLFDSVGTCTGTVYYSDEKLKSVFCGDLNAGVRCEAAHVESRRPQEAAPLLWRHLRKTMIRTGPGAPPQGVAPQPYN
jgi:hypothetical protein